MVLCSSVSLGRRRNRGKERGGGGERGEEETLGRGAAVFIGGEARGRGCPRGHVPLVKEFYCEREHTKHKEAQ